MQRPRIFTTYRGLPKEIYILFFVQVINRFGDFVMPFLVLYLTTKLGYSVATAGVFAMVGGLMVMPGSMLGGKFADWVGRNKTYVFAQTTAALSLLLCVWVKTPELIIGLLLSSMFFNGAVRPCINAMVADILPPERRQLGYSLLYLGINIGVALGPMLAGFLFHNYLNWLFVGDAVTSFVVVTLVVFNIKESRPDHLEPDQSLSDQSEPGRTRETELPETANQAIQETNKQTTYQAQATIEATESGNLLQVLLRRKYLLVFFGLNVLLSFVYTQFHFSVPLMMNHIFGQAAGPSRYGLLISVNAVTVIFGTVPLIAMMKRFKPLTSIALAGILYAIGFGLYGFTAVLPLLMGSTIIWTLGEILAVTNYGTYLANRSPANFRARISSLSSIGWALGSASGTFLVGLFIEYRSITALWPLVSLVGLTGAMGLLVLSRWESKHLHL